MITTLPNVRKVRNMRRARVHGGCGEGPVGSCVKCSRSPEQTASGASPAMSISSHHNLSASGCGQAFVILPTRMSKRLMSSRALSAASWVGRCLSFTSDCNRAA